LAMFKFLKASSSPAAREMVNDPDIKNEEITLNTLDSPEPAPSSSRCPFARMGNWTRVSLNWKPGAGGHRPNSDTLRLLHEVGGKEGVRRFTELFYEKVFQDPHLDRFIRDQGDPHGERFANWIVEKFGEGTPWSEERRTRKVCPFQSHGHIIDTPHDRSSAHFAAWHSPKREAHEFGQHFKLDDCRIWMRLHFWAMREAGIFEQSPGFADYYIKFIGHFVSVYERSATVFARESARWSEDPHRVEQYIAAGRVMQDVEGVPFNKAVSAVLPEERRGEWPYSE